LAFSNHLASESSPYLLQHAHNPVDWYPWGEEALNRAKAENKPILISIGYSACHWCHVMERESFEDEETASIMNARFINIKIDREERPDLDHIYMDAVQAMTGSGGWPLNVFLTPEGKPFYGGTYYPKQRAYNRPSWKEILESISNSFREKRAEIDLQSENLTGHLLKANGFGLQFGSSKEVGEKDFTKENLDLIFSNIMQQADTVDGGFGGAPKFPQTFVIQFLLHYHYFTKNEQALRQACLSLDKMILGGIYDQIGGGFSRYATDSIWLVPHFEKMLYDNALLITVLSEAYQLTGHDRYLKAIRETIAFAKRELSDPKGGFYSALDADSEGEEGKFYVWEQTEVEAVLGEDAPIFCAFMDVTRQGNWEGKNIFNIKLNAEEFARHNSMDSEALTAKIEALSARLLKLRNQRIRPQTDDKILLSWNALMISACGKAYAASGMEEYRKLAVDSMDFIWTHFKGTGICYFHHSFKEGLAKFPGFLDDYALVIAALIQLQEITGNSNYLRRAKEITSLVIENFSEKETGFFFFTHKEQQDLIFRKKEIYDGAVPSGNAIMAFNLLYLSTFFDLPEWKTIAIANCRALTGVITKYPSSFGIWATLLQAITYTVPEIVVLGAEPEKVCKEFLSNFIPYRVFQSATSANDEFPLLRDKPLSLKPQLFLCQNYTCQTPVTEVNELILLLKM
jgi:uncharacterized protein YyaL (SSP411 family)